MLTELSAYSFESSDLLLLHEGRTMRFSAGKLFTTVLYCLALISVAPHSGRVGAITVSNVENQRAMNVTPTVLVGSVSSKDIVRCARVTVSGLSRLKLGSYSSAHRITLIPSDEIHERSHKKIQICIHSNSSLGLCRCQNDDWVNIQSGIWSSVVSPYAERYIDVKLVDNLSGSVTVSVKLEFQRWRLICLAIGFVLLLLAPIVSSWVPFYYSSSMAIGVCLVVIIVLFQAMKIFPTGRKTALYSTICGLAVGAGAFLINRLSSFVNSVLANFGISEELHNPVLVFFLVLLVLAGAAFGYWLVRKFVVAEDGSVDVGIAQFVKWALRVVAVVFIFQSTLDIPLALGLLFSLLGLFFSLSSFELQSFRDFTFSSGWSPKRQRRVRASRNGRTEFLRRSGTTTTRGGSWNSPRSAPAWSNSPLQDVVTPSRLNGTPNSQEYYSTFHRTPNRKKFSKEEWKKLTEQSTRQALAELGSSPEFSDWMMKNADRIRLQREDSSDESIGSGPGSADEYIAESSSERGSIWRCPW